MLILVKLIAKLIRLKLGKTNFMAAKIYNFKTTRAFNNNKPLLSMFMVRRQNGFKVITNLAQLTADELVSALVRDAVCNERETAIARKIAE